MNDTYSPGFRRKDKNRKKKRLWCRKHLFSVWYEGYPQCYQGFIKGEECEKGGYRDENTDKNI
jgi:hypothetical protein